MNLTLAHFDREADLQEQRRLFSECFPENEGQPPQTEAFYRRKFTALRAQPPSYEFIARDECGIAGYYAALPFTYLIGDERLCCGMVCDVMTTSRLRGKGVFTKLGAYSLAEMEKAGLDFVSGYPRRAEVIPGHLKVGWTIAFRLPMYLLPLRTDRLLGMRKMGFMAPAANTGLALVHRMLSCVRAGGHDLQTLICPWQEFVERFDIAAFGAAWRRRVRNALLKDDSFLRWRLSIHETTYWVVAVQRAGQLVGVSIVRQCAPEGVPALAVIDLMCLGDDAAVVATMLASWRELAANTGAEVVLTMMSECRASDMQLWRCGFIRTPVVFSLILKNLSARAKRRVSADPAHWSLMWIDSDDL